ncbi:MAG: hypothetical protein IJD48_04535 [Clostridia bacterium]|nr:hypothetical protein [Clostridia bacterium]
MSFLLGYIDPAATSILLSSITTIAIAIGAVVVVWWRKAKKKVSKTLKLDPNKGKEVEDDLVINEEVNKVENSNSTVKKD